MCLYFIDIGGITLAAFLIGVGGIIVASLSAAVLALSPAKSLARLI